MYSILFYAGIIIVPLLVLGIIASRLYTRSTQERAFVRTGLGGTKVVMSGGALVLPVFHELVWVNRNTLRLEVARNNQHSLITKDRLRVDVSAEFYVRVAQSEEALMTAAQTLGEKTQDPAELNALVEGKFVDALRSAAANMTMEQLADHRTEFVANVKQAVSEDLSKNGLELESVSLTGLNQTKKEYFDPNNAFDAEGLLKLTREIQTRNKTRNDVEQDTKVEIERKNLATTQQEMSLRSEREKVTLETEQGIASMKADQTARIAETEAAGRKRAEQANLQANQEIAQTRINTEQSVAQAEAASKKVTESARLEADTAVKLRSQDLAIEVAQRSELEAAAQAAADKVRAGAVAAEEAVTTARLLEVAKRERDVTLVRAEEKAREGSIGVVVAAEAEMTAAEHRAAAARRLAEGQRDAALLNAEAVTAEGVAVAEALEKKNTAQNILSPELIAQQVKLALLTALPAIIEQTVAPLANIDSIRIAEVGGLNNGGNGGNGNGAGGNGGDLSSQVINSALKYRVGQPLVDALMSEVGLKGGNDINSLLSSAAAVGGVAMAAATPALEAPAADAPSAEAALQD